MVSVGVRIGSLAVAYQGEFLLILEQLLSRPASVSRESLRAIVDCWRQFFPFIAQPILALGPVYCASHRISSRSSMC